MHALTIFASGSQSGTEVFRLKLWAEQAVVDQSPFAVRAKTELQFERPNRQLK